MAMPPGGPMEVVFSFDTTGSMSQVLDEVKARVNDIVQRLQADIPGFKVGIIAHGDYCDVEHFYDIRTLDLTDSVADVVTFVNDTEGTGGGDIPECYELALRHARDMSWTPGSRRVLVVIGDAYPHGPDYEMNKLKIDWQEELASLMKRGVRIYGVQVQDDPDSTSFFLKLTSDSGGQHLKLANMNTICQVIMGICYREHGTELFENYEAELRADKQKHFGPDLECVFGALRKEGSKSADAMDTSTATPPTPDSNDEDSPASSLDDTGARPQVTEKRVDKSVLSKGARKIKPKTEIPTSSFDNITNSPRKRKTPDRLQMGSDSKKMRVEPAVAPQKGPKSSKTTTDQRRGTKTPTVRVPKKQRTLVKNKANFSPKRQVKKTELQNALKLAKPRRENVTKAQFKYSRLPWSTWQLAVSPAKVDMAGDWRKVAQRSSDWLWKRDLLDLCLAKLETLPNATTVFELGLQSRENSGIKAVFFHSTSVCRRATSGVFGTPWYSGMFRGIRQELSDAVLKGCKVYLRWAIVEKEIKKEIPRSYDYAWSTGREFYIPRMK